MDRKHYKTLNPAYEPIKIIQYYDLDFCLGNVIKYVLRAGKKDGNSTMNDLLKAKDYINYAIDHLKPDNGDMP